MTDDRERSIEHSLNMERSQKRIAKSARRQKLIAARKGQKRNYKPKGPRRKNWIPDHLADTDTLEDWDDLAYAPEERIMPRDEGDRRRTLERAANSLLAATAKTSDSQTAINDQRRGIVLEVSTGLCQVDLGARSLLCRIPERLRVEETAFTNVIAVGDEVIVGEDGPAEGVIEAVLPRRSVLARPHVQDRHLHQVIVANVDQLLVVSSWREPVIWPELIDRYLIAAARNQLPAVICINKIDLVEDEADLRAALQPYRSLDYGLILTSALSGDGLDDLRAVLEGQTTVLAGLSGVGKSSLLMAVQPGLQLQTRQVSASSGQGQHTTSQATMRRLDAGGAVVDTPGIREFGLSGLNRVELARFFPEIAALAPECRFNNCAHLNEPDCAVQNALEAGRLAASRYHSYEQIYDTLPD
jgi:ribosome biogenesis GTPase / thiamine phosphate phosphatase